LILALVYAYRSNSIVHGIEAGGWAGLASGLVACGVALSVIVFGMHFLTRDPLNVAEHDLCLAIFRPLTREAG
jgi:hypothetical protein